VALANPSFETADPADPGLADDWAITVVSFLTIAGFTIGAGLEQGWEGFEAGWDADGYSFGLGVSTTPVLFSETLFVTPPAFEDFSAGWALDQAFFEDLGSTIAAEFNTTPNAFESFDVEWGVTGFATTLAVSLTAAPVETFETGWLASPYTTSLGANTNASFDGPSAVGFEDFDDVIAPVPFTLNPGTDVFTAVGHPLTNGMKGRIASTGQPPGGASSGVDWYVVNAATDTFQLAATPGGTAHDFEHQGGGVHTFLADPTLYWNEILS